MNSDGEIHYLETDLCNIGYQNFGRNSEVGVMFMGGLASNMMGTKATYVKDLCKEYDLSFTRFDYFGHGISTGELKDGNISIFTQNAEEILKRTTGKQVLIGSSMSGWMMYLLAEKYPEKIKGLIGIGAAPDFTEDCYNSLDEEGIKNLNKRGYIAIDRYGQELRISKNLLEDGKKNLILNRELKLNVPAILMHGLSDDIVSYKKSIQLAEKFTSNVKIILIKSADHNMKDEQSLHTLAVSVLELCE